MLIFRQLALLGVLVAPVVAACGGATAERFNTRPPDFVVQVDPPPNDMTPSEHLFGCYADGDPVSLGSEPNEVDVSPDGAHVATSDLDGMYSIGAATGGGRRSLPGETPMGALRWSRDGKRLLYIAGDVPMIANADGTDAKEFSTETVPHDAQSADAYAEWAPDGQHVAFGMWRSSFLSDVDTRAVTPLSTSRLLYPAPWEIAFNSDASTVAVLEATDGDVRTLRFVSTADGTSLTTDRFNIYSILGWSPDDRFVAIADTGYLTWIADAVTSKLVQTGGRGRWSPKDPLIAIAKGSGGTVVVLDPLTSNERVIGTDGGVWAPTWSPDGSLIAFEHARGDSAVVRTEDGTEVATLPGRNPQFGPNGWVASSADTDIWLTRIGASGGTTHVTGNFAAFTASGKLARMVDTELRVSDPDGSSDRVICQANYVVQRQSWPRLQ